MIELIENQINVSWVWGREEKIERKEKEKRKLNVAFQQIRSINKMQNRYIIEEAPLVAIRNVYCMFLVK